MLCQPIALAQGLQAQMSVCGLYGLSERGLSQWLFIISGSCSWQDFAPHQSSALSIVDPQLVLSRCLGFEQMDERLGYTPDL